MGSVSLFGCLPNTNPQQLTTRPFGKVPYWQRWPLFFTFLPHRHSIQMFIQRSSRQTILLQHKLHTHCEQTQKGANPGAGTVCLCVWICITQLMPGRSQSASLKVHKSWMVLACDHQAACFSDPQSSTERQTASSFGLRQTLWNVLMGRELIFSLNLSGSLVQHKVYHLAAPSWRLTSQNPYNII